MTAKGKATAEHGEDWVLPPEEGNASKEKGSKESTKSNSKNSKKSDKDSKKSNQESKKAKETDRKEEDEEEDEFLRDLQSDDSFHGMLPLEDITKLLVKQGDYIIHTIELEGIEGRIIGISILWNAERVFCQVKADAKRGVSFDMMHFKKTILHLVQFHVAEKLPVTIHNNQAVMCLQPVLREEWELRHDDIELYDKLGEGQFGEVRLGKLHQKNKGTIYVAVKVIKGKVTKTAIDEAMKEARIMRRYNHHNVVRFYGVQAEIEPLMLVIEFIKGGSLDKYLKKNAAIVTVSQRASMCYDSAIGLEYLHAQNCIHRDIAARNCLIDIASKCIKISDFGLSSIGQVQVIDPTKPAPIRWLAPEVIRTAIFTKAADVWSFGVLCWEIYMSAEVPYKQFTMKQVQARITTDDMFRLTLPTSCQPELRMLIMSCWIKEVTKRPTMSDCVRAFAPFFDSKNNYIAEDHCTPVVMMAKKKKLTTEAPPGQNPVNSPVKTAAKRSPRRTEYRTSEATSFDAPNPPPAQTVLPKPVMDAKPPEARPKASQRKKDRTRERTRETPTPDGKGPVQSKRKAKPSMGKK